MAETIERAASTLPLVCVQLFEVTSRGAGGGGHRD